jgi:3-dehydroquinate synthase
MGVSPVPDPLIIQSHKGPYEVHFDQDALERLNESLLEGLHILVDARVAELYQDRMGRLLAHPSLLTIKASEDSKELVRFPSYVGHLVKHGVRRGHHLVAIGGGVIQDITCFLAATLLRGVPWRFLPTTLLAQADSCIGSKSSINCGGAKNILGTFTPPQRIDVSTRFLDTLDEREIRSGIGEMLKVHAIAGPADFARISADYEKMLSDRATLLAYMRAALLVKQRYIEEDEFDQGIRNVFNYGHSFGHAIEAATGFAVPHGIAVTLGMDMANHIAAGLGLCDAGLPALWRRALRANYRGYETTPVPFESFLAALAKDKKNQAGGTVTVILPHGQGKIAPCVRPVDETFRKLAQDFLERGRVA